jgi:hypothetical protein
VSEPAFECPSEWTNDCGCPDAHNSCWPEPIVGCCPELQVDETTAPEQVAIIEQSKRIAVQLLHAYTGRQFGLCPRIVRPCRDACTQPVGTEWVEGQLRPTLYSGVWINDRCGKCGPTGCSCTTVSEVTLPGPVYAIVEITLDGVVLSPLDYRVDNRRKLVAQGTFTWPTCQDMTKPAGEVGTWTVEYQRGMPVPEAGRWAAGLLACELVKACDPATAGECRIPENARSIVREGVTLDLEPFVLGGVDGSGFGKTGIPEVDMWIASVNPYKLKSRSRVYSPDRPAPRRTTWPCP